MSEQSRQNINNVRHTHKKDRIYRRVCKVCGYQWNSTGPNAGCPECKKKGGKK